MLGRTRRRTAPAIVQAVATFTLAGLVAGSAAAMPAPGAVFSRDQKVYQVAAAYSSPTVMMGDPVEASGTVKPKAAGATVAVQEKSGKKWKPIATTTLDADGAFEVAFKPTRTGDRKIRICKAAGTKIGAGCSATQVIGVYQWGYLTDRDYVDRDSIYTEDPMSINGTMFKKSLGSDGYSGTTFIEYNLSRRCTELRATVGIGDESETGANGLAEILVDGTSKYRKQFSLGQSAPVSIDVTDGLRVRLEGTTDSDGLDEYIGFGSPQVLCK